MTARIIAQLEEGRFPWVQPWASSQTGFEAGRLAPGLPRNALTARTYSGINILILWGAAIERGLLSARLSLRPGNLQFLMAEENLNHKLHPMRLPDEPIWLG
ncbi:ArdC-like ssDNA-binding domain-containing protein [Sphingobium sp.]|uniref:ArdC-like ssDNA-binding domain-containing protein n=1 Tax=Sphingobium sp. TaxID=1912891 RepID=UPI0039C9913B